MQKFYGYMRVSTILQNDERQRVELEKFGIVNQDIYADKRSGKDFDRPAYQKLRKKIKDGDVLVVKSLDRLGRNYEEIQNEWRYWVKEKNIDIVVLDMPILDTRTNKDLIGTLISDIVLQLLSYVAQAERENIRQRQAEGIAIAKAQGRHLGRLQMPFPIGFEAIFEGYHKREITSCEACELLGVSKKELRQMFDRKRQWLKRHGAE